MNKSLPSILATLLLILPLSAALAADTTIQLGTGDNFVVQDSGATPRLIVDETTGKVQIDDAEIANAVIGGAPNQGDIWYDNGTTTTRLPPGTAGQVLTTQGAAANPLWVLPLQNVAMFTSGGGWIAPAGVTRVFLTMVGGGAAGGDGEFLTGGSGGTSGAVVLNRPYTVVPGNNYSVTVGAGGVTSGQPGTNSSFDGTEVASGSGGGGFSASFQIPGQGSLPGGSGGSASLTGGGGGSTFFGRGAKGGALGQPGPSAAANTGAGGAGAGLGLGLPGGSGGSGLVILTW